MLRLIHSRLLRFFSLFVFFFGVQAQAQFEVSPDHVDSTRQNQVAKKRVQARSRTSKTSPAAASAPAAAMHKRASRKRGQGKSTSQTAGSQTTATLRPR